MVFSKIKPEKTLKSKVSYLTDSCAFLGQNRVKMVNLILDFKDLDQFIRQKTQKTWYFYSYRTEFFFLVATILLAKILKKHLKVFVKEFVNFKEVLKNDLNIQDSKYVVNF